VQTGSGVAFTQHGPGHVQALAPAQGAGAHAVMARGRGGQACVGACAGAAKALQAGGARAPFPALVTHLVNLLEPEAVVRQRGPREGVAADCNAWTGEGTMHRATQKAVRGPP